MDDELEFLISQYADGTLGEAESRALEAKLAEDAEARAVLEKHRRLTVRLRALPTPPMSDVQWDRLSARIGSAVAKTPKPSEREEVPMAYRLFAGRFAWAAVGLAASVFIAAGLAIRIFVGGHGKPISSHVPVAVRRLMHVSGPRAQVASGPAMTDVSIGPGKALAGRGGAGIYGGVVSRPSSVLVASGGRAADDSAPQTPF
ncbi:MAG TPA: hypothetical protein VHY37_11055 [Tepidisphaeraceae bacterium]|jgi:anti-sigma factor RsiW|nr:hypothetical protein [Tepidisphaeraceae bacterium]